MTTGEQGGTVTRVVQVTVGRFTLAVDAALVVQAVTGPLPLLPLPRVPSQVLGACDIRGTMVPVFDLPTLLEPGVETAARSTVGMGLLLRQGAGRFILPIDALHGMRTVEPASVRRIDVHEPTGPGVFTHLIATNEQFAAAVLLDVDAVLRLADLHTVITTDGETDDVADPGSAGLTTCIAVRAGSVTLAIPSSIVRQVEVRDLTIERRFDHEVLRAFRTTHGEPHAVVDLLSLLGLPVSTAADAATHLIAIGESGEVPVAMIVDQLLGIERLELEVLQPAPALADPTLCRGTVLSARHGAVLVLDPVALLRAARIIDASALMGGEIATTAREDVRARTNFMVYAAAGGLLASPMSDFTAITALPAHFTDLRHDASATIGLLTHNGHTVPVTDLGMLLGKPALSDPVGRPVLLVATARGMVAFATERVLFMRQAEPRRIPHMALRTHGVAPAFTSTIIVDDAGVDRSAALLSLVQLAARADIETSAAHAMSA